jgi:DNA-binding winged helix-turn-helix (wHTH) protein/TolB-like protein/tetratricopeptide (TPR) repeat protein
MVMSKQSKQFYEFGPFQIDVAERMLLREGAVVPLPPKAFDTLLVLVENRGHLLEKEELMHRLWPETFVEEANLPNNISLLRKALGDDSGRHLYIETVPRRGYRFVAEIAESTTESPELVLKERSRATLTLEEAGLAEQAAAISRGTERPSKFMRLMPVAVAGLLALGYAVFYFWPKQAAPQQSIRSIAVLPFKPLVADSRDEALEMGMADTLITRLSNSRQTMVRPLSAVRHYTGLAQDPVAAGRDQRVDAVLDGSIQKSGERIRVTVRLVSVADAKQLWSDKFDERFTDIFVIQDRISQRLMESLATKLVGEESELLTKHYTDNTEAYQLYVKGLYCLQKPTEVGLKNAIEQFRQALEKDPGYALAYAGLSKTYIIYGVFGWMPPKESYPKAREAAIRALELDEKLGEAQAFLSEVNSDYYWDWPEADRRCRLAIDRNPNYAPVHVTYSWYLTRVGRFDEAIREAKRAQELDPLSLSSNTTLGFAFLMSRQYDQAVEQARTTTELDPGYLSAHVILGFAYLHKEMYREAISEFQKAKAVSGGSPNMIGLLGYAYAVAGKRNEAAEILEELNHLSKQQYVSPSHKALLYMGLGERQLAFEWLEKAYEDRNWVLGLLKVDAMFDPLRSDQRFQDLLRRVGLSP